MIIPCNFSLLLWGCNILYFFFFFKHWKMVNWNCMLFKKKNHKTTWNVTILSDKTNIFLLAVPIIFFRVLARWSMSLFRSSTVLALCTRTFKRHWTPFVYRWTRGVFGSRRVRWAACILPGCTQSAATGNRFAPALEDDRPCLKASVKQFSWGIVSASACTSGKQVCVS